MTDPARTEETTIGKIPQPDEIPKENKKKEGFGISLVEVLLVAGIIFILYLIATR